MSKRASAGRRNFPKVLKRDNEVCQYCEFPADSVDHIVPYSWSHDNSLDNLVAACFRCNLIASDFMFSDFTAKRDYILSKRRPEILKEWGEAESGF